MRNISLLCTSTERRETSDHPGEDQNHQQNDQDLFNKGLLSPYRVPGPVLDTKAKAKTKTNPAAYF